MDRERLVHVDPDEVVVERLGAGRLAWRQDGRRGLHALHRRDEVLALSARERTPVTWLEDGLNRDPYEAGVTAG